jgi:hypothetical protein
MNDWLRRFLYESPADQGAGEGIDDLSGTYDWGDSSDAEYARRFPGGPQEMWKSLNETRGTLSQRAEEANRAAEELAQYKAREAEEAETWSDPLEQLPDEVDDAAIRRLQRVFLDDPQRAYELAVDAAPGYGTVLQSQIMQAWQQRDPIAALHYVIDQRMNPVLDERFQSMQDELADRLGPTLAHTRDQMNVMAINMSRQIQPDIEQYEPRLSAALTEAPNLLADVQGDPAKMAQRLVQMRDILYMEDERAKRAGEETPATKKEQVADDAKKLQQETRRGGLGRSDADAPNLVDDDYAKSMSLTGQNGGRRRGIPA